MLRNLLDLLSSQPSAAIDPGTPGGSGKARIYDTEPRRNRMWPLLGLLLLVILVVLIAIFA